MFIPHVQRPSDHWFEQGQQLMNRLTMPPRAMGDLLDMAAKLVSQQETLRPQAQSFTVVPFVADHGMVRPEITNSPRVVTTLVATNMARGEATVARLTKSFGGSLLPVNMGVCGTLPQEGVVHHPLGSMTADFTQGPAMTPAQRDEALSFGAALAESLAPTNDFFVVGEMGVGNTTCATALFCGLTGQDVALCTGLGSGIDEAKRGHKIKLIDEALTLHGRPSDPLDLLCAVGGFELAGLVGFILGACAAKRPVVLDGFVTSTAACLASRLEKDVPSWLFASHLGAEEGHRYALQTLGLKAPLSLGLKLGEGAGGVLAVPLLRSACLMCTLPTFEQSGVPEGLPEGKV